MKISFYQFQNRTSVDTNLISWVQCTTGANHKARSKQ